jgi:hypothetical protein
MPFQILPQPPLTSTAATPPVTSNSDDLVNEVTANVRVDDHRPHTNACFAGKDRLPDLKDFNDERNF